MTSFLACSHKSKKVTVAVSLPQTGEEPEGVTEYVDMTGRATWQ